MSMKIICREWSKISGLDQNMYTTSLHFTKCIPTLLAVCILPPPSVLQGAIAIVVKDLTDQQFRLQIQPTSSVKDLKSVLQAQYGIAPENTRLLFRGRRLDDLKTLQDYNIVTGNIIQMSTKYVGGRADQETIGAMAGQTNDAMAGQTTGAMAGQTN